MRLAAEAEAEAALCTAGVRRAEAAYEAALSRATQTQPAQSPGGGGGGGGGGWLGWFLGEDVGGDAGGAGGGVPGAEAALGQAEWAAATALQEREERVAQRVAALAALTAAEAAHMAALDALARWRPPPARNTVLAPAAETGPAQGPQAVAGVEEGVEEEDVEEVEDGTVESIGSSDSDQERQHEGAQQVYQQAPPRGRPSHDSS